MRIVDRLAPVIGVWKGVNRLRLLPTDHYRDSDATATVSITAREYVTVAYTWSEGDEPQNGLLLVSSPDAESDRAEAVWVDSWHCAPAWLALSGAVGEDGVVRLLGSYAAPPGPDWGWEIHIDPGDGSGGRITMHNQVPGEKSYQVVDLALERRD